MSWDKARTVEWRTTIEVPPIDYQAVQQYVRALRECRSAGVRPPAVVTSYTADDLRIVRESVEAAEVGLAALCDALFRFVKAWEQFSVNDFAVNAEAGHAYSRLDVVVRLLADGAVRQMEELGERQMQRTRTESGDLVTKAEKDRQPPKI